ncbi:MAG: hypothetical protein QM791_16425 [Ferruginibacter sp.]
MKWEVVVNFSLHVINFFLFCAAYKRSPLSLQLMGIAVLVTFFVELYAVQLMLKSIDNNFIYHFLTPVQYSIFALSYMVKIRNRQVKKIILFSIPAALIVSAFITIFWQGLNEYNSIFCSIKHALLSFWILWFFMETFMSENKINLVREPFFWISAGLLLSSLGNFFIEGLMNLLISKSNDIALRFYLIGVSLTYIFYFTVSLGFLLQLFFKNKSALGNG